MSEDRLMRAINRKRAVELHPPARPVHGVACRRRRLRGIASAQALAILPATPKGRAPDPSRTSARATRSVAYTEHESL